MCILLVRPSVWEPSFPGLVIGAARPGDTVLSARAGGFLRTWPMSGVVHIHRQDDSRPHLPAHPGRSRSSQWLSRQLYSDRHDLIISGRRIAGLVTISGGGGRRAARPRQRLRNGQRPSRRARPPPGTGPSFEPATAGERLAAGRRSMWRARLRSPGRHGHTGPATARRSGP